jgi:TRAP-type C4-dicarboxylate transport system permease small subunit
MTNGSVLVRPIDAAIRLLSALNAPITRWGRSLSALLLALMLAVATAQIISRAAFNYTLDWAEELARMALVWSVLLAAPLGYRSGAHVAIAVLVESLPARWLYAAALVINLLVGWICLMLLIESVYFVERGMTIVASGLPVRMGWIYSLVPLSLAALVSVALEASLRLLAALARDRFDLLLSGLVPVVQSDPER